MNIAITRLEKTFRGITVLGVALGLLLGVAQPRSTVQADRGVCATPGKDGPVTITAVNTIVNTYYPGTGAVAAGATSITVDNSNQQGSSSQIASGDLLLVIQMQGAEINSTQSNSYGDGVAGAPASGQLNNANFTAGRYEYVMATSSAASGSITISSPLIYGYNTAAATATLGERSFQVIRVPQYSNLTINNGASITAYSWTSTPAGVTSKVGGIVVFDVTGTLSLGGGTVINVAGQGFRAGGGRTVGGSASGSNTDVRTNSNSLNQNASKGEGIAGTPRYLYAGGTTVIDRGIANEGYPNGAMARGAPGNAGGGGTDGDPAANDQNTGGGGGSNAGSGGKGGFAWSSIVDAGGFGGAAFLTSAARLVMGGGGGAGTINNTTAYSSSGGTGGGMVMIRAGTVSGTGTINANGNAAPGQPNNDSGGGGGAGGSVLLLAQNALPAGLNITATGGRGGDAWPTQAPGTAGELMTGDTNNRHGPGAGGGGGAIFLSSTAGALTVSGGNHGITTTANSTFGSENGNPGVTNTSTAPSNLPGGIAGATCLPNTNVVKTTGTPVVTQTGTGTTGTYTITVSNPASSGGTIGVNISDTLPTGFSYASTGTITYSGGATRTSTSDPTAPTTTPAWGVFYIPSGGSVAIPFTVNIAAGVFGTFQNPAVATYSDPVRTTAGGTASRNYDPTSSTGEDIQVLCASGTAPVSIAQWRFSNNTNPTPLGSNSFSTNTVNFIEYASVTGNANNPAIGYTNWSSSYDSNRFLQFDVPTTGYENITFQFGANRRGNNSPTTIQLGYSSNGTSYSLYSPTTSITTSWADFPAINLGSITILDNNSVAKFRLFAYGGNPNNNANRGVNFDTVTISGCALPTSDLAITKTNGTTSVNVGGTTTYTVRATNNGPSAVTGAILSDPAATGLSKTAVACSVATPGQCVTPPTIAQLEGGSFALPALASGATYEITITANVTATSGSVTNTATITAPSGTTDPTPGNNSATDTDFVNNPALTLAKTATPATYDSVGDVISYSYLVTNSGNVTLSGPFTVSDDKATVTCLATASLVPGDSLTCTASYTITLADLDNGSVTNTASATNGTTTSNTDSETVDAVISELSITKSDIPDPVTVNGNFTYTITVTNNGPDNATGVVVMDNLPSAVTFVSASPVGVYDDATGQWNIGNLASGASVTLDITVTAPSSTQTVQNTATVSSDTYDPDLSNNRVTELTTVQQSDPDALDKTLTATSLEDFTNGTKTAIGEVLTYQVKITVPPGTFENAGVVDTLDQGLAFVACDSITPSSAGLTASSSFADICAGPGVAEYPSGSPIEVDQGRQVTYDFGTLINSTTGDIILTITYRVVVLNAIENQQDADPPVSLNNAAVFSWENGTPISGAAEPVSIVEPDLEIEKTASPTFVRVGDTVTYTITIRHTSASQTDAFDTVMQDEVPAELGIILSTLNCNAGGQAADTCTYDAGTRTVAAGWDDFTLTGGTGVVRFQATVLSLPPQGGVTNTANVEWTSLPGDPGQISTYNPLSTERYYDPEDPANNYGTEASFTLNALIRGAALPATGFAPGVLTKIGTEPQGLYSTQNDLTLEIPSLKVNLPVVGIHLQNGNWDLTWLSRHAGWLEGTAYPTLDGNSVLTAHVYLSNGLPGPFIDIDKLSWGQEIAVVSNGLRYIYQVREVSKIKPDDMSVFKHEEKSWITLLTCKDFNENTDSYNRRTVVRAVLVGVKE